MILVAIAAATIPLAPPLDRPLHYRVIDRTTAASGTAVMDTEATLRFHHDGKALIVGERTESVRVTAPPRRKAALDALLGPFTGVTLEARVAADGTVGALIAPEARWAAQLASQRALVARIDADPAISPEARAAAHAAMARMIDPARREETLRPSIEQLLPPALPPPTAGARLTSKAMLATPTGVLPATTIATWLGATPAQERFQIETITAAAGTAARFADVARVTIDRHTGLLVAAEARREVRRPGAAPVVVSAKTTTLLP